jgi:hypothetical protein
MEAPFPPCPPSAIFGVSFATPPPWLSASIFRFISERSGGTPVTHRQRYQLLAPAVEERIGGNHQRVGALRDKSREGGLALIFGRQAMVRTPTAAAASWTSFNWAADTGKVGLMSTAMRSALGTSSRSWTVVICVITTGGGV